MTTKSFYQQSDDIIRIIDSGPWKHSQHLPKNGRSGVIDWFSLETHRKVVDVMQAKRVQAEILIKAIDAIEIPPESYYL